MENFIFHNPTKLIFGRGMIEQIGPELAGQGFKKVLLIAGGGSIRKNRVYARTTESLKKAGVVWSEAWGVKPNPVLSKVNEIIKSIKDTRPDALLAVGGGSVIDTAKTAAAGIYMCDVWQAFEKRQEVIKALPLCAILTISATGSEMNQFAVVTNEREKKKWNISGPALYPRLSIVDPSAQTSLPWKQTVNGALDAMAHVMEFYFMGGVSETTLALDESLLRSIVHLTDALKKKPRDYDLRANLAWAATLALNGISGAGQAGGDWACHGIEHGISALNPEVAHGAGLGIVFPAWIEYCQKTDAKLFRRWAKNVWGKPTVDQGISAFRKKIRSWKHPVFLSELNIDKEQIAAIADHTVKHGMTGTVKKLSAKDIINILELAF